MPKGPLPDAFIDLLDGRLGTLPPSLDGIHAKVGVSSLGATNSVVTITSLDDVTAKLGTGPLAEKCAATLQMGLRPIYAVPAGVGTAGSNSTVTVTRASTPGTANLTVSGTPRDDYDVIVRITRAAANLAANLAAFQFSLDGGDNWSLETSVPVGGAYNVLAAETGLTLTFVDGTFVVDETFAFRSTGPVMSAGTMGTAVDAVIGSIYGFEAIHVVGSCPAAVAVAFDAKLVAARNAFKYLCGIVETRMPTAAETVDQWKTAIATDYVNFSSKFVSVVAAWGEVVSQLTGRQNRANLGAQFVGWSLQGDVSASPGEVIRGGVPQIVSLGHNEYLSPGLDAARFVTFRTYDGINGFYITNWMSAAGVLSDFQFGERGRTINKVCRLERLAALRFVHSKVRVTRDGKLDPRDLGPIQAYLENPLNEMQARNEISNFTVTINPDQNILSTSTIFVDIAVVPVGIARWIGMTIGFANPRLQVAA
jgi:hypothetical protein